MLYNKKLMSIKTIRDPNQNKIGTTCCLDLLFKTRSRLANHLLINKKINHER